MKEIVNRLHENRQIELAREILESNGYTVTKKSVDEGLFGKKKAKSGGSSSSGKASKVTFKVYDANGSLQFNKTFDELDGKKSAEEQMKDTFKDDPVYRVFKKNNPSDWTYERVSNPSSNFDTKRGRNYFLSDIGIY